ncbi:acyl carrier protein [Desulfotignum phosphitoxidans]|uniref:Acyl carrier domain-containing protein n=1 Tax=Desulfotignum phosphitoxidans DSM 13687 TaxID=1286635 RepID=S0FWT9_9BACT|nr:acyl carrier protein [Desulfotignum phosphitoxidans]EMS79528.1 acyl carrier domain-containing protein [Desulfotignum phosphitoxidans DSM 13687]
MSKELDFLTTFFEERGITVSKTDLNNNFMLNEHLDSFGVLTLFIAIEEQFSIKIKPADIVNDNNKTLSGLIKLIQSKQI